MNSIDKILEENGVYEIGEFNLEELLPNLSDLFTEDTLSNNTNLGGKLTNVKIIIYSLEGVNVPHFHIHSDNKKMMPDGDCCIMICEPKYFIHGNHRGKLNNKQAKNLNDLLSKPYRNKNMSIWEYMYDFWKRSFGVNLKPCQQPDYSKLNLS